jgi:hypothetical protein
VYGILTTGVSFQGLNIDIGHVRSLRWVKDDDPSAKINQPEGAKAEQDVARSRWIAYNRQSGQYKSLMESGSLEQFWVDKSQCQYADEGGKIHNPGLPACGQGISAVKAIALAQQEGQKIYTITQQNADTALTKLPVSGIVGQEVRNAIQAGKEVTIHEKPINAFGWKGYGYIITDPETGAGAYTIEGSGNGGFINVAAGALSGLVDALCTRLRTTVNGPYDEIARAQWLTKFAKATALLSFAVTVADIVNNDSLNMAKKVTMITSTLAATAMATTFAGWAGAFFAVPAVGAVVAIIGGIAIAFLLYQINLMIQESEFLEGLK